ADARQRTATATDRAGRMLTSKNIPIDAVRLQRLTSVCKRGARRVTRSTRKNFCTRVLCVLCVAPRILRSRGPKGNVTMDSCCGRRRTSPLTSQRCDSIRPHVAEPLARAVRPMDGDVVDGGFLPEPDVDPRIVAREIAVRGAHVPTD